MPYALQSPLASAAGALGGYLEGVQSKKDKEQQRLRQQQQDAQAQADTQARLGLERSNQEATNAYRRDESLDRKARLNLDTQAQARADAAAAETAKRQKLIDTFQGQGLHYPKGYETMKPEAKIGYLQVRLNKAQQAGDTKTVSSTETEINRVATEAEQARRDAAAAKKADALEKQRGIQNEMGQQRISISLDRASTAGSRASAAAGDPQSFADVSGRLAHAKSRDDAQKVLDSPEGSLLSDRQYTRLQKQVDETYGTHQQSLPKTPKAPKRTALDEVRDARSHGIKDNKLIINTLVGNGYSEASAKAAVQAAP